MNVHLRCLRSTSRIHKEILLPQKRSKNFQFIYNILKFNWGSYITSIKYSENSTFFILTLTMQYFVLNFSKKKKKKLILMTTAFNNSFVDEWPFITNSITISQFSHHSFYFSAERFDDFDELLKIIGKTSIATAVPICIKKYIFLKAKRKKGEKCNIKN